MTYNYDCRFFTGYKPCQFKRACDGCAHYDKITTRVAIVSLEALGAVLRSTALLHPIKRKLPGCHITWITLKNAKPLLAGNPMIDSVVEYDTAGYAVFEHLKFDYLFAVDKSLSAGALAEKINAREKFGFGVTEHGAIRPFNSFADYQFEVGLNDQLKFFENQKPETQQITESMGLSWKRDPYVLALSDDEKKEVSGRRTSLLQEKQGVIGYNTGCSLLYPYKKFTVEKSIELINLWRQTFPNWVVALLGGREDEERQTAMKKAFADDPLVVNTPTNQGLRSGILWMDACDWVFTGCSLGLHIGVALSKPVIAWFGVSCSQEIDLYEKGFKLQAKVSCSPCWKKSCTNEPKCFNEVSLVEIKEASQKLIIR
ncbi:MAG: glycosyltransferase family 9 protein [Oligoflexales bacterium]